MTVQEFKQYLDEFLTKNPELKDQELLIFNESQSTHHPIQILRDDGYHDVVSIVIYDS